MRRLSKIATLLLAKNYIVMLQRTVDELQRLLVHPPHHHDSQRPASPHDGVECPPARSQSPAAGPRVAPSPEINTVGCAPPPPEVLLSMTSSPSAMLNERLRSTSHQREKVDWSATTAALAWQQLMLDQRRSDIPLHADSTTAAMVSGLRCQSLTGAAPVSCGRLLAPWMHHCASPVQLMTTACFQPRPASPAVADTHRGIVRSF